MNKEEKQNVRERTKETILKYFRTGGEMPSISSPKGVREMLEVYEKTEELEEIASGMGSLLRGFYKNVLRALHEELSKCLEYPINENLKEEIREVLEDE